MQPSEGRALMAWVRIHDAAITHPKIVGLSDKCFRLWVWGLSYSQQHLTDGALPAAALPPRLLAAVDRLIEVKLWEPLPGIGWKVHDYLDWNDSREVILAKRDGARQRLTNHREKRVATPDVKRVSSPTSETALARSGVVLSSSSSERESEGKPRMQRPGASIEPDVGGVETTDRAARLLERYAELFSQHRLGAKYFARPHLDLPEADRLIAVWDDARLEKLAILVLTTDDPWISRTDRGFKIFAMKASWADDRLRAWETEHGVAV